MPQNLVLSFSELSSDNNSESISGRSSSYQQNAIYSSSDEAFFNQNIFYFVGDETNAMLEILFCESRLFATFFNPLYSFLFALIYLLTLPGATLHYMLFSCIPVRKIEFPEERELRSQGMYTAMGVAIISIPFASIGLFLGTDIMVLINEISLGVNCCIIISNLIGLKVIADEFIISIRVFAVGAWVVDFFMIGLALIDVYSYITFSWLSCLTYFFRIVEICIYTIIALQCILLWNLHENPPSNYCAKSDYFFAFMLVILFSSVIAGFTLAIYISESNAWRIMYW